MHNSFFPAPASSLSQLLFLSLLVSSHPVCCSHVQPASWIRLCWSWGLIKAAHCSKLYYIWGKGHQLTHASLAKPELYTIRKDTSMIACIVTREIETVQVLPWAQTFLRQVCVCCYTPVTVRTILIWKPSEWVRMCGKQELLDQSLFFQQDLWELRFGFTSMNRIRFGFKSALINQHSHMDQMTTCKGLSI